MLTDFTKKNLSQKKYLSVTFYVVILQKSSAIGCDFFFSLHSTWSNRTLLLMLPMIDTGVKIHCVTEQVWGPVTQK